MKLFFMNATEWNYDTMEPKGWFMTEKYDGMRLYWNGKQFISKSGKTVSTAPESMIKKMPSVPLDGELWTQYGLYQDAISLSNSSNEHQWKKATYWVFDAPKLEKPLEVKKNI